jgi:large subunit ribosomal protein L21
MYAVIRTGGKQYRVAKDDLITVEKLDAEAGASVELGEVLMVGNEKELTAGAPLVDGATVSAEVIEQRRGDKIIVFKKKRRKGYSRTRGHRQHFTVLRITDILTGGAKPTKRAAARKPAEAPKETKPAAKPKAEVKPAAKPKAAAKPAAKPKAKAKPAAKKPTAKPAAKPKAKAKPVAKKPAAKPAATKPAAKKTAAKKPAAKKPAAKKAPAKKRTPKKS